jgi:hypothetical protein
MDVRLNKTLGKVFFSELVTYTYNYGTTNNHPEAKEEGERDENTNAVRLFYCKILVLNKFILCSTSSSSEDWIMQGKLQL